MGLRISFFTAILMACFIFSNAQSTAPFVEEVLVLNGGMFNDPTQNVVLTAYNPQNGSLRHSDTIFTQSIQDLVVTGDTAYLAAQDSVVMIDLTDMSRIATAAFPGPSTYSLLLHNDLLFVGNWFGAADSNLYVFNAGDLSLNKIIGNTTAGVKGMAVLNDTLYISQNLTSSSWSDSAGYLGVIDLNTLSHVRDIPGNGVSAIGTLFSGGGFLFSINGGSDTYILYNGGNSISFNSFGVDVSDNYGSYAQLVGATLWGVFNGNIGGYDLINDTLLYPDVVDTAVAAFQYDPILERFYVTSTDFASYKIGLVYDNTGMLIDSFEVGLSPEAMGFRMGLNNAPLAVDDQATATEGLDAMIMVLDNDSDPDGDVLSLSIETAPTNGTATIMADYVNYTPATGFIGTDSVEYKICDDSPVSLCATAWARVTVEPATGISEFGELISLNIYPNPTTDMFSIYANTAEELTVNIYNVSGQQVYHATMRSNTSISTTNWAKGMYIVKLTGAATNYQSTLIKQ